MEVLKNQFHKIMEKFLNKSAKNKILIVILTGVILLVITFPAKKNENKTQITQNSENTNQKYEEYIEEKLENTLSKVEGVGKVKVIISIKNTGEKIIAADENSSSENIQESDSSGGTRNTNQNTDEITNIYYDSGQGNEPFVKMENMPEIQGVIVVAQGGGDGSIANNITSAVESLLGVPVHKIKVLKMS